MFDTYPVLVASLTPRQRYVLVKCVGGRETEQQVGEWLGISQQAVARILGRAQRRLRLAGIETRLPGNRT